MNNNQTTVNQHYVPRCYMKNFSIVKGSGKKEKQLISFYQFDRELLRKNIPTESVCYEKYFYGEDGKIEKNFAAKETEWARVIRNIVSAETYNLDKIQEKAIKEFATFQYCRTLAMYNHSKNIMSEFMESIIPKGISEHEINKLREQINEKIENELSVSDLISTCEGLLETMDDLNISLIKFNTEKKLITSDMPIIMINPFSPSQVGFAMVGIIILFPVSPEKLVMIYDDKIYIDCNKFMTINNEKDVINLNKYQVISAEERILSKEVEDLSIGREDKSLILKKKEIEENRKLERGSDGVGTLLGFKSRKINYDFELSFCKLPLYLRKIPKEYRESFERQYKYELRKALLVRIYKTPELVKKNPDTKCVNFKKMRDSYSNLLKFMDEYWNVPDKERIVTPKLINELKSVKATYFKVDKS